MAGAIRLFTLAFGMVLATLLPVKADQAQNLIPQCKALFDLCGYVDAQSKKTIIPDQFELALEFSEGLAAVKLGGKFGYVNANGDVEIAPQFDLGGPFNQGLAEVLVGDKVGVVNRWGMFVIEPQFARAIPLTSDNFLVSVGAFKRTRFDGDERLSLVPDRQLLHRLPFGLFSLKAGWLIKEPFDASAFGKTRTDLFWATDANGLWGLMKSDGRWQLEPQFSKVMPLEDGRARAHVGLTLSGLEYDIVSFDHWRSVDETGKLYAPSIFDYVMFWRDGFGFVSNGNKKGLIDKSGRLIGGRYFDNVDYPDGGKQLRVTDGQAMFLVNPDGSFSPYENSLKDECATGLQVRRRVNGYFLSYRGVKQADQRQFQAVFLDCDGPSSVQFEGKWGFVDQKGMMLFGGKTFDSVLGFEDGYAAVETQGKWGVIDTSGKFTAAPIYQALYQKSGSAFLVSLNGRNFWINPHGQEIAAPLPTDDYRRLYGGCPDGSSFIKKDGLFGLKAPDGTVMVEPKYRALTCFRQGIAWAANEAKRMWCPLDSRGELPDWPECMEYKPTDIMYDVRQGDMSSDPYESSVLWNRAHHDFGLGLSDKAPPIVSANKF